jgi:hypothetical protein
MGTGMLPTSAKAHGEHQQYLAPAGKCGGGGLGWVLAFTHRVRCSFSLPLLH